jgi:anti-sigma factor RsiW
MPNCASIDPLVTSYVDDEIRAEDRQLVEQHVRVCATCRIRIEAERVIRDLLATRKTALQSHCAPAALHEKCARLRARNGRDPDLAPTSLPPLAHSVWRARFTPLALAATLVLIVGAAFLYQLTTSSARVMAAELTADHVKCFAMNAVLGTHQTAETVQHAMASGFDWSVELPQEPDRAGLELVGSRPCLYGEGRVAHIMYRHNGQPVSLFMLPKTNRSEELMQVLGHEAAIWSVGDHTFVLIARETRSEVERLAAFVRSSVR